MIKPEWNNLITIKLLGGPMNGETREVGAHVQVFEAVQPNNAELDPEPTSVRFWKR